MLLIIELELEVPTDSMTVLSSQNLQAIIYNWLFHKVKQEIAIMIFFVLALWCQLKFNNNIAKFKNIFWDQSEC